MIIALETSIFLTELSVFAEVILKIYIFVYVSIEEDINHIFSLTVCF